MRHNSTISGHPISTSFLQAVNGPPGFGASHSSVVLIHEKQERQEKIERCGRSQSRNPHGFRGRSKSKKYIKCYHCNKIFHMKKECRIWRKEHNEVNKENKETNATTDKGDIMIVIDDGCVSLVTQDIK